MANLIPSGNPFLDVCLLRGGFPSPHARFCTDYLKIRPIRSQVYQPVWDAGQVPRSWQGVRRQESRARAQLDDRAPWSFKKSDPPVMTIRPLLEWVLADVWAIHKRHGIEPNPLYREGASRVGCGPCIYAKKGEVRMIDRLFPEAIERIREWEALVALVGKREPSVATFFSAKDIPGLEGSITTNTHGIDAKVRWSKTAWGGKQFDMFEQSEIMGSCAMIGLCE